MRVEILGIEGDRIRFVLEGADVAFANALRRTVIAEVPCMAIDDLFIFDNSSVVVDEVLAHRIGLVPLRTDLDRYILPEDCDCESELGCDKCRVILTLDVEAEIDTKTIYSGDFVSDDPAVVPVNPDIPLTKIAPGQAVRIEAYAKLGRGKTHAKWQPVSEAIYQHVVQIEVDQKRCTDCAECVKACPRDIFTIEDGKLKVVDVNACIICRECEKACPTDPSAVLVGVKPDAFLFTIESTGCLSPEKIVTQAGKILVGKLDEFTGKVERGEVNDEISGFEAAEQEIGRLYSVGTGDFEDEEEEERGYDEP
ncbi:MAG: DNA-directed RNA polymerase subunit D [Candidatus Bathyarchaeota archaeon]|jgi:DNA-directed RNA polymerase subunit D